MADLCKIIRIAAAIVSNLSSVWIAVREETSSRDDSQIKHIGTATAEAEDYISFRGINEDIVGLTKVTV